MKVRRFRKSDFAVISEEGMSAGLRISMSALLV
jgi:hypothetical protein